MLTFSGKDFNSLLLSILNRIDNSLDKREGSLVRTAVAATAWGLEGLYGYLETLQTQAYARTATGKALDYKAEERGVLRLPAVAAIRLVVSNVALPIGARLMTRGSNNNLVYFVSSASVLDGGLWRTHVTCETPGLAGNAYYGVVQPISSVPGLTSATMSDIALAGSAPETDAALRQRYLDSLLLRPFAGNIDAYRIAVMGIPGVGAVQIWPVGNGPGTVVLSILDSQRQIASPALVDLVQDIICPLDGGLPADHGFGIAPIGAMVTVMTAEELPVDVWAKVTLNSGASTTVVQTKVEAALKALLAEAAVAWDVVSPGPIANYSQVLSHASVVATIFGLPEVADVDAVTLKLNGDVGNLVATQSPTSQEFLVFGGVTLEMD